MSNFKNSQALLERAKRLIPSATQTFSKGPNQWVRGVAPHYLDRGQGAWVWDVDGNKYLDYLMALGPIILGYGNRKVNEAIATQLEKGSVFSMMNALEVEVAELLCDIVPCAEMVRFAKTGSDTTSGAIRAARAYTGREHVACSSYHGWHDWYIGSTTRSLGVPEGVKQLTHSFTYNQIHTLEELFQKYPGQIAAVIMEPVGLEKPADGFLEKVKALTKKNGAVLIFDEIVTGFRFALGGAQEYFGVTPDLACFGKAMANGMPVAAVVGRKDIMKVFDDIFFSGTFNGEALSLAACKATIETLQEEKGIQKIWESGESLIQGIRKLIEQNQLGNAIQAQGYSCKSAVVFPHADEYQGRLRRSYFMQECIKRGLLFFGNQNVTMAHGKGEIDFTLKVFSEVMPLFAEANKNSDFERKLEGECVEPIFRKA